MRTAYTVHLCHGSLLLGATHRGSLTEATLLGLHGPCQLLLLGVAYEVLGHHMAIELVVDVRCCLVGS